MCALVPDLVQASRAPVTSGSWLVGHTSEQSLCFGGVDVLTEDTHLGRPIFVF